MRRDAVSAIELGTIGSVLTEQTDLYEKFYGM